MPPLTAERAAGFARIALGHIGREYPNKLDHVLTGPDDLLGPRALHPVFFGSLDWHSCVHGTLAARPHPPAVSRNCAEAARDPRACSRRSFTAGERRGRARLSRAPPASERFRAALRLGLAADARGRARAQRCARGGHAAAADGRLVDRPAARLAFLPKATYPVRAGTHANTAFALTLVARVRRSRADDADARRRRLRCEGPRLVRRDDADCQAWEPERRGFSVSRP